MYILVEESEIDENVKLRTVNLLKEKHELDQSSVVTELDKEVRE